MAAADWENVARVAVVALGALRGLYERYAHERKDDPLVDGMTAIFDAVDPASLETASPEVVQEALDKLLVALVDNDERANALLDKKFGNSSADTEQEE